MPLPRMRTIKEAVAEFKTADPFTSMNETYLRRLIILGKVPFVTAGRKYLVNMDVLTQCLSNQQPTPPPAYGTIRQIPEK